MLWIVPRLRLRLIRKGRPSSDLASSMTWPSTKTSAHASGASPGILGLAGRSGRNPVTTTLELLLPNTAAPIAKLRPSGQPQAFRADSIFEGLGGRTGREGT